LIPVLKTTINQPTLTLIGPPPMTTKLVTSNPPLSKKEVVEPNVGEVVVFYDRQVRTVEHVFNVSMRGNAMRTSGIHSKVGIVMERGGGESSGVLTTERSLRRGRGKRRNSLR